VITGFDPQKCIMVAEQEEEWVIGVQEKDLTEDGANQVLDCGKDCSGIYLRDPVLEGLHYPQMTLNYGRPQDSLAFQCPVCLE
jgi:hypothetical protein